jgi:hypothetical protein
VVLVSGDAVVSVEAALLELEVAVVLSSEPPPHAIDRSNITMMANEAIFVLPITTGSSNLVFYKLWSGAFKNKKLKSQTDSG